MKIHKRKEERFICTKDHVWDGSREKMPVEHPDAQEVRCWDGWPAGDIVEYRCPHCGHTWKSELPQ